MRQTVAIILAILPALLGGCAKEPKPVLITQWEQYQEPFFLCTFRYPKEWQVSIEGTRVSMFSLPDGAQKFFDPTSRGEGGSQLIVAYEKTDGQTVEGALESYRTELTNAGYTIQSTAVLTLAGERAFQVIFTGKFDDETRVTSARTLVVKDSMLYYFHYSGFNDSYAENRSALDTLLASVQLPKPKVLDPKVDPALPSSDFSEFSNNVLQISYPSNFEASFPMPKGEIKFSIELKGYRQDCSVRIDAFPAKGNSLDKIFEQNQKFYNSSSQGATTIDGLPAKYLDYSPAKGIQSRVYFVVKKDNVYRVITNYYQAFKKDFVPAFEKTVGSIRIIE